MWQVTKTFEDDWPQWRGSSWLRIRVAQVEIAMTLSAEGAGVGVGAVAWSGAVDVDSPWQRLVAREITAAGVAMGNVYREGEWPSAGGAIIRKGGHRGRRSKLIGRGYDAAVSVGHSRHPPVHVRVQEEGIESPPPRGRRFRIDRGDRSGPVLSLVIEFLGVLRSCPHGGDAPNQPNQK